MNRIIITIVFCIGWMVCSAQVKPVAVGAEATNEYFPLLKGKRIAVLSNHTGMVGNEHLVDLLKRKDFNVFLGIDI